MFEIRIDEDAHEFLLSLHPKSQKIIKENLRKLETNLFLEILVTRRNWTSHWNPRLPYAYRPFVHGILEYRYRT